MSALLTSSRGMFITRTDNIFSDVSESQKQSCAPKPGWKGAFDNIRFLIAWNERGIYVCGALAQLPDDAR